jgi:hypothetical protein
VLRGLLIFSFLLLLLLLLDCFAAAAPAIRVKATSSMIGCGFEVLTHRSL